MFTNLAIRLERMEIGNEVVSICSSSEELEDITITAQSQSNSIENAVHLEKKEVEEHPMDLDQEQLQSAGSQSAGRKHKQDRDHQQGRHHHNNGHSRRHHRHCRRLPSYLEYLDSMQPRLGNCVPNWVRHQQLQQQNGRPINVCRSRCRVCCKRPPASSLRPDFYWKRRFSWK
jgi:hypothetical protein